MSGSWDGCVTLSLGLVAEIRGRHVGICMQYRVLQEMRVFCSTRLLLGGILPFLGVGTTRNRGFV